MKKTLTLVALAMLLSTFFSFDKACGRELQEVKASGVLRHLGIPYANFVTGSNDGMDVEIIQGFAKYLGVRYEFIQSDWDTVVEDLIGKKITMANGHAVQGKEAPVKGDLIANGFTILPWREELIDFSKPTFPSKIWLIARADSQLQPIRPSKDASEDIEQTRALLKNRKVLTLPKTCLDPSLYHLGIAGATVLEYKGNLNEIAPALIKNISELSILDVPDALIALEKWPGKIKILGPISSPQFMAVGFAKTSSTLLDEFNNYFEQLQKDGTFEKLARKYYPTVFYYFPEFFKD